jgi:hypothetical protein
MLRAFNASNRLPLANAPRAWIERAMKLGQKETVSKRTVQILAELVFDSWTVPHPVGVRGEAVTDNRRLRFECPEIIFDLHAEHGDSEWAFVAQAIGSGAEVTKIRIGRRTIVPDGAGIYQWSSNRPPKKLSLVTEQKVIDLPELIWKRRTTK